VAWKIWWKKEKIVKKTNNFPHTTTIVRSLVQQQHANNNIMGEFDFFFNCEIFNKCSINVLKVMGKYMYFIFIFIMFFPHLIGLIYKKEIKPLFNMCTWESRQLDEREYLMIHFIALKLDYMQLPAIFS
jgi:hypothetical protein